MYRILVVDDEHVERAGIIRLLQRVDAPIEIFSASNGKEALAVVCKTGIDVIITDIRMPVMDGLELSHAVRARDAGVRIIICSAYGEFGYARRAMAAGVRDYLLKPVDLEEFNRMITRVLEEREAEQRQEEAQHQLLKKAARYDTLHLQWQLQTLVRFSAEAEACQKAQAALGQALGKAPLYLLFFKCQLPFFEKKGAAFHAEMPRRLEMPYLPLTLSEYEELMLLYPPREMSGFALDKLAEGLVQSVRNIFSQEVFVLYCAVEQGVGGIGGACRRLEELAEYTFFMPSGCAIPASRGHMLKSRTAYALDEGIRDCLLEDAAYGDIAKLCTDWQRLKEAMRQSGEVSHLYFKSFLSTLFNKLYENGGAGFAVQLHVVLHHIVHSNSMEELTRYVDGQLEQMSAGQAKAGDWNKSTQNAVRQAVKLLHKEYANNQLNLEYLAQRVCLSPNYLGALFKKDMDVSFNKYLNRYRLGKAAELLVSTNVKIVEISSMVGFSSDTYFVTVFSNVYGTTPTRYRERHMAGARVGSDR